ncbi:MFS transporter [Pseudorhizobium pelagicum]|uniref:Membrane protein n=1 Tax=Pseudorhizobium pelagicum TaxID=1509405 RepID=A0A922T8D1_9HYPH|nr:MFS transporter [Pseudorhizobium pelagicum]KEQ03490.1 membrane protein [Pseudorhizobium pelagicum]KEQ04818.1 membrane protein [Pseudorhizobium pelagicum]
MPQETYRWVIVAAGGLLGCMAIGSMFTLPVLIRPIVENTGWSVTGISTAMTIAFVAMALGSMAFGSLSDHIGARPVVLMGSGALAASLAWASRATSMLEFQLIFGLVVGLSIAAILPPLMASVMGWFDTHRSLAVSLVSAGMGMAPMTVSPFAAWLVSNYDWRFSLLAIAGLAAITMIPLALLIRRPPALPEEERSPMPTTGARAPMSVGAALTSSPFIVLMLTNFFCCATHSGPIFHTVGYAVSCGIPLVAAVTIYSVEGLAGLGGRVAFGIMGDRFGAKNILVLGLLAQAIVAFFFFFARQLESFYAIAAMFGFIYAGVMPLYAVLARENFPQRMMGTIVGGTGMAGGLGMALGPWAGGLVYDTFATYSWLYLGACGLGLGAFLIALTFRPFPRTQAQANIA